MMKSLALIIIAQASVGMAGDALAEIANGAFHGGHDRSPINAAQDPLIPSKKNAPSSLEVSQDPSRQVIMAILAAVSQKKASVSLRGHSTEGLSPSRESKARSK